MDPTSAVGTTLLCLPPFQAACVGRIAGCNPSVSTERASATCSVIQVDTGSAERWHLLNRTALAKVFPFL